MSILDEYRRNAEECQRMAEKAGNAADQASWLRLAASWLGMIKTEQPRRVFSHSNGDSASTVTGQAWPKPSNEDSKSSH